MAALILLVLLFWVAPIAVCNVQAERKGKDRAGFILLGVFLGWLGALIAALIPAAPDHELRSRAVAGGTMRRCPFCAEAIQPTAVVCRYCGHDLSVSASSDAPAPRRSSVDELVAAAANLVERGELPGNAAARLRSLAGDDLALLRAARDAVAKDVNRSMRGGPKAKALKLLTAATARPYPR